MRERPILFNGEMVRAILAGAKTQTRRPIMPDWWRCLDPDDAADRARAVTMCPFGRRGDRPWVRETWGYRSTAACSNDGFKSRTHTIHYRADDARRHVLRYDDDGLPSQRDQRKDEDIWDYRDYLDRYWKAWRPSIHMPRWASRLTLEATDVGVERLQDISEADARAEGFEDRAAFLRSWAGIYGDGDPWVWVVSFKRVEVQP